MQSQGKDTGLSLGAYAPLFRGIAYLDARRNGLVWTQALDGA